MADMIRAVILGIVEGLTEFLPISSTGHLILTEPLLGIPENDPFWSGTFDVFIQIGAILAVAVIFWQRLWRLTIQPDTKIWSDHILFKLFVAFLPSAIIGKLTGDFIEAHMKTPLVVACALVIGGVAILVIELVIKHPWVHDAASVSVRTALLIGFIQCLAMIFPGTSRSGATIMGALLLGLTPAAAAEFSFFLAIPTMFAAGGYSLLKHLDEINSSQVVILAAGFIVSFLVAWLVVKAFMKFIQTHRFTGFAIYRIILGAVVLTWFIARLKTT